MSAISKQCNGCIYHNISARTPKLDKCTVNGKRKLNCTDKMRKPNKNKKEVV